MLSGVFAASLLMAFAILGFAVLHAITRGMSSRIFMLAGVYAAAIVLGWPVLAMAMLGLAETTFDIRGRVATQARTADACEPDAISTIEPMERRQWK